MSNDDGSTNDQETGDQLPTPHVPSSLFGTVASLEQRLEAMRAVTQPLGGLQKTLASMRQIDTDALTRISSLHTKIEVPTLRFEWLRRSKSVMREIENWRSFQRDMEQIIERQQNIAEMLRFPSEVLAHDLDRFGGLVSDLSIDVNFPNLSERMLAPLTYYSRFSRDTLTALQGATEGHRARALSGSLLLAEDQLSATTDLLADILQSPIGPDQVGWVPTYTLFERTREDLLGAEELPPVDEPEGLYEISRSTGLAVEVREVLKRTASCNRNAEMQGEDEVFRPTTAMFESAADLGFLAPAQEDRELGPVVDALYKLLYEGAGAGPNSAPRYLERGYVSDGECAIIWRVKHLRNHWFRHDYGHGSRSDQKRKMERLGATLEAYGLNRMPATPEEYAALHRALIRDVRDFLELLERRIS